LRGMLRGLAWGVRAAMFTARYMLSNLPAVRLGSYVRFGRLSARAVRTAEYRKQQNTLKQQTRSENRASICEPRALQGKVRCERCVCVCVCVCVRACVCACGACVFACACAGVWGMRVWRSIRGHKISHTRILLHLFCSHGAPLQRNTIFPS